MAIIPLYLPRDRPALEAHFSALGALDLRNRFCGSGKPDVVSQYMDQLTVSGVPSYGIFNARHALVAVCQLGQSGSDLEVGITVLPAYRRQGLGNALLMRCASYARARRLEALVIHCLADNAPMLSLARQSGMSVEHSNGEADGRLMLRAGTSLDFWAEMAFDQQGIADSVMRSWQFAAQMLLGTVAA